MDSTNSFRVLWREVCNDKIALIGFILFWVIVLTVYIWALFVDPAVLTAVDLLNRNQPPSAEFILGTGPAGQDMLPLLIVAARNSFNIAFIVTIGTGIIGILVGLIAGFYAGHTDNIIMRVIDFVGMVPFIMLVIVFVAIIPNYNMFHLAGAFILFGWMGTARLVRAMCLRQGRLDYVAASKTLGTPNIVIIFREVLPNLISIITSTLTLNLAANMGIETGLTFLGFGIPPGTPSLGRLIFFASVPYDMQNRMWLWLPAALLIIIMMLCINFVGQALNRAADAKKRLV